MTINQFLKLVRSFVRSNGVFVVLAVNITCARYRVKKTWLFTFCEVDIVGCVIRIFNGTQFSLSVDKN